MLTLVVALKLVCEVALMCLAGRGVLSVLAGERRVNNVFYKVLFMATQFWVVGVRPFTPRFIPVRLHPWVAFALLGAAWLWLALTKVTWCLEQGAHVCR